MNRVRTLFVAALIIAPGITAHSQAVVDFWGSQISNVDFHASNIGMFAFDPTQQTGFIYPRGSGISYLFGTGLWFGAKHGEADSVRGVFTTFNPNDATSQAWPGEIGVGSHNARGLLALSGQYDHATGKPTVAGREDWPLWSTTKLAPRMAFPGIFEPDSTARLSGSRYTAPAFVPGVDEQIVARFNDVALDRYGYTQEMLEASGQPFGLQITQNIYAWAQPPYDNCVIVQYQVINVGAKLRHCYIGQVTDPDMGNPGNDHLNLYAQDTSLRAMVAWTQAEGTSHGLLVSSAIETPVISGKGTVDNSQRSFYGAQMGISTLRLLSVVEDPTKPWQRYDVMAERRIDTATGPVDVRALQATGPFDLLPLDTAYFAILYGVFDGTYPPSPATAQKIGSTIRELRNLYYFGTTSSVELADAGASGAAIDVLPNPATDAAVIRGLLPGSGPAEISLFDPLGRSVLAPRTIETADGRFAATLDLSALADGVYLATVRSGGTVRSVKVEKRAR